MPYAKIVGGEANFLDGAELRMPVLGSRANETKYTTNLRDMLRQLRALANAAPVHEGEVIVELSGEKFRLGYCQNDLGVGWMLHQDSVPAARKLLGLEKPAKPLSVVSHIAVEKPRAATRPVPTKVERSLLGISWMEFISRSMLNVPWAEAGWKRLCAEARKLTPDAEGKVIVPANDFHAEITLYRFGSSYRIDPDAKDRFVDYCNDPTHATDSAERIQMQYRRLLTQFERIAHANDSSLEALFDTDVGRLRTWTPPAFAARCRDAMEQLRLKNGDQAEEITAVGLELINAQAQASSRVLSVYKPNKVASNICR